MTATATVVDRGDETHSRAPPCERSRPGPEHRREREHDQRYRARRRAQREPEVEMCESGEDRPVGRRVVERMRADRDDRADREECDEVAALLPPQRSRREQPADREQVARADEPQMLRVGDARLDPRAELVVAVEEPVPEAAQQLRRVRDLRHGLVGLGVAEDRDAVLALRPQPGDPPQRDADRQHADAADRGERPPHRRPLSRPTWRTRTTARDRCRRRATRSRSRRRRAR